MERRAAKLVFLVRQLGFESTHAGSTVMVAGAEPGTIIKLQRIGHAGNGGGTDGWAYRHVDLDVTRPVLEEGVVRTEEELRSMLERLAARAGGGSDR